MSKAQYHFSYWDSCSSYVKPHAFHRLSYADRIGYNGACGAFCNGKFCFVHRDTEAAEKRIRDIKVNTTAGIISRPMIGETLDAERIGA